MNNFLMFAFIFAVIILSVLGYVYYHYFIKNKKSENKNIFNNMHHKNDFESVITYHSLDSGAE
jgi:uncharacterized membrane protein YukC